MRRDFGKSGDRDQLALCTVIDLSDPGSLIGPGAHKHPVSLVKLCFIESINLSNWMRHEYH
jgi:hypothetical protein